MTKRNADGSSCSTQRTCRLHILPHSTTRGLRCRQEKMNRKRGGRDSLFISTILITRNHSSDYISLFSASPRAVFSQKQIKRQSRKSTTFSLRFSLKKTSSSGAASRYTKTMQIPRSRMLRQVSAFRYCSLYSARL